VAGIQEVATTEAFPEEGHTPYVPQAQPGACADGWRADASDSEASGAQEAVHDGDLCSCGPGAGEKRRMTRGGLRR
jgi:hypothetical protein